MRMPNGDQHAAYRVLELKAGEAKEIYLETVKKELDELPSPAQLKERYPDTSRWDARLQAALHKHRPVLKRVLVAAMTLVNF